MSNTSNPQMNAKILLKHVNISKNLHKEVKNIENTVNWAAIINTETSHDVISTVANQFVQDVNKLIYNLHDIMVKVNKNLSSYNDLKVLIIKLSKTSYNLQESFGHEFSVLRSKLLIEIQNIVKEAQSLTGIIEKDELHEFKTVLVDSLSETLSDLQKIQIYYNLKQLTPEGLEEVFKAGEQECLNIVAANHLKHETCVDKTVLEGIIRHTYHGVDSTRRIVYYLHNAANNYSDPIKGKINEVAKNLNTVSMDFAIGMYQMNSGGEGTFPLEKCMIEGFQAFRNVMKLLNMVNLCDNGGKGSENLKHLVFYSLSALLCLTRRFVRDMSIEVLEKM